METVLQTVMNGDQIKTYGTWGLQEVRDIDQLENVVNLSMIYLYQIVVKV